MQDATFGSSLFSRRQLLRTAGGLGVSLALATAAVATQAQPAEAITSGFRWCSRCQSLWFIDGGNNGHCPVTHLWDHSHYQNGSGPYVMRRSVESGRGQVGWHWCLNCKMVYYSGNGELGWGRCPNDPSGLGVHQQGDQEIAPDRLSYVSFRAETELSNNGPGAQTGWRFCVNCNGMFFAGNGVSATHCPAGGTHSVAMTWNYLMRS